MRRTEAREHLLQLLGAEGQEPGRLDLLTTWRVFGRFMNVPLEDVEEDGMKYEYLTASFGGPRRFILSLCRQFHVLEKAEGGDVAVYTQLTCELSWIEGRPEWNMIIKYPPVATSVYEMDPC